MVNQNQNNKSLAFLKKGATACGHFVRTTWLIIGATILLLIFLELTCGLVFKLTPSKRDADPDKLRQMDSYQNAPWIGEYFQELRGSYDSHWRPYVYWRRKPFKGKYINVNDQGIRSTSSPGEVSDGARGGLKIFMFGGSTMWGEGVRDQYTIPSLVLKELAGHKIRAEITNFGEVAYVNTQELIELVLQLERGNVPDIAVFYDGWNDTYAGLQNGVAGFPQFEWRRKKEYNLSNHHYYLLREIFLLQTLERFQLWQVIKSLSPKSTYKESYAAKSKTLDRDIVEIYLNNVKIISSLGQAYGFVPLFYWQPVIYSKNHLTDFEKLFNSEPLGTLYRQTHAALQARQAEFAPYNFADISDLFAAAKNPVYIDYCHVNEDANQVIAARITADLLKLSKLSAHAARKTATGRAKQP